MKSCNRCKIEKEESEFVKKRNTCKKCWHIRSNHKWHNDPVYREREKIRKKKWRDKNIEYCRAKDMARYEANKDQMIKDSRERYKKKRLLNPLLDYEIKLRGRFGNFFRGKTNKNIQKIVGCTLIELKNFLAAKFTEGMDWNNYGGRRRCWTIDHAIPLSSAKTPLELEKLFYYTNLQPLWMTDNIKKSNKL